MNGDIERAVIKAVNESVFLCYIQKEIRFSVFYRFKNSHGIIYFLLIYETIQLYYSTLV